jgi:isopenicillin-N N-acyltransferase-like protein
MAFFQDMQRILTVPVRRRVRILMGQSSVFPSFRFEGSHRSIGQQYGETCRSLIHLHLAHALERLRDRVGVGPERIARESLMYRPFVQRHALFFDDEIVGLAEGAGIELWQAYLLQLRAEVAETGKRPLAADECTTFVAMPERTRDKHVLIGQNADLPAFYREVGVVVQFDFADMPTVLMLAPAGQISYIGINSRGVGACANFLTCDGWRYGFPRYLLSRHALTRATVKDAVVIVRSVPRASSRNLLVCDATSAIDMETTVDEDRLIEPRDGLLVHANHYVHPDLIRAERSEPRHQANSRIRHERLETLLRAETCEVHPEMIQRIYRDRGTAPDTLCRSAEDDPTTDTITFASLIAEPDTGKMWVAMGPPHEHDYVLYSIERAS